MCTHQLDCAFTMARWDPTEFQKAINDFLARRDWSQAELARATGLSPGVVNRWLQPADSGMLVRPTDETLRKVADVVGIPLNELLRMVGRADVSGGRKYPPATEAWVHEIATSHMAVEDKTLRERLEEATRAMWRPHAPRRPDRRRAQRERQPEPEGDSSWGMLLTPA